MRSTKVRFEIGWKTIFKVLLGVLLAVIVIKLWPLVKLLVVSALIAVALYEIVWRLCEKGWPRWSALLAASLALVIGIGAFFGLLGPMLLKEASRLGKELPAVKQQVLAHLPNSGPVRDFIGNALNPGSNTDPQKWIGQALSAAKATAAGIFNFFVMIVFAIYFMVDGPRALAWMVAFFPAAQRRRVSQGLAEIRDRMVAYTVGQFITSAICAVYAFIVLSILKVPMALLLAVMAGVLDVLPVLGFLISVVPAMALGLSVSPLTSLLVLIFYSGYHLLENYLINPRVYGRKLNLSNLAVLLSITVGGLLAGVIGAVVVLPFVAAYPALERLWLGPKLQPEVVRDHQQQMAA